MCYTELRAAAAARSDLIDRGAICMMNEKRVRVLAWCVLILAVIGGAALGGLNNYGLLSFRHPLASAQPGQVRVACVGDSVTYGYGIKNRAQNNYPAVLQTMLGDGYCVNNYGYSGRTASDTGDRPYRNEALFLQSLDFAPDIVVLMLGSNDSKAKNWDEDAFVESYTALLEQYLALPSAPLVFAVLPTPVFEAKGGEVKFGIQKDVIAEKIVPLTRDIAKAHGVEIIDMYSVFEGRSDLFSDGCHPTAAGAALFAKTVYAAIAEIRK